MSLEEVRRNIGQRVVINGNRDLGIIYEVKHLIDKPELDLRIAKLTKSGLAYIQHGKKFYSIPTSNVDLLDTIADNKAEREMIIKDYFDYNSNT